MRYALRAFEAMANDYTSPHTEHGELTSAIDQGLRRTEVFLIAASGVST